MRVCCAWGEQGLQDIADKADVIIVVDVLSFSTAVDIATSRGGMIYPTACKDDSAAVLARELGAELAGPRGETRFSLSPECYLDISFGTKVVLPSPNGGKLSSMIKGRVVYAGCLRNASAVARAATKQGGTIAVVAAGERWPDSSLRPALEDWLGAGAIIAALYSALVKDSDPSSLTSSEAVFDEAVSATAASAAAAFLELKTRLPNVLEECKSGQELLALGYKTDVMLSAEHDVSWTIPQYTDGVYVQSVIEE